MCAEIQRRRQRLVDDLRLHVGLPTGGNNTPALEESRERLCNRLALLGATVELVPGVTKPDWLFGASRTDDASNIPPTAICRRTTMPRSASSSVARPCILIAGHLDTVHDPVGPFRELTIAPDGKSATGPGCVDMKGGLVIAVAALEVLAEVVEGSGGVGRTSVDAIPWTVLLNSDEETGSYHSEPAIRAEASSGRYACGLALEPATAEGGLVIERAGSGQFMLEVRGKSAHVGRDFAGGVSAVTTLAEAIVRIAKLPAPAEGRIVNIGPIQGGTATNVVPDLARAWGNVRFSTPSDAERLAGDLAEIVASLNRRANNGLPSVILHTSFNRAAKPLVPATMALAERAREVAEALGQKLPFSKTAGVCDGNIMQGAGLPTIDTVGVRGGGLHTPQEWIDMSSLVERCQMFAVLMMRLAEAQSI